MDYELILGDCLEKMDLIQDGSVDMILADLPYGTTACKWDVIIPFEPLWKQYKRVIKRNGAIVLFGSEPFSSFLRLSNLDWYKYDWVWDKVNHANFLLAKIEPLEIHENILVFCNGRTVYSPQKNGNAMMLFGKRTKSISEHHPDISDNGVSGVGYPKSILRYPKPNNLSGGGLHPTQKPVALLEYLIKTYSNEGDLILDNAMGSGSTGEACLRTGRRFIGIEKDEGYFNIAKNRLDQVKKKLTNEDLPMFAQQVVA